MDMGLQDKVAIITGGSYGIGKAAALSMAREGARGQEYNAWSEGNPPSFTVILPFTRMLSGPMDFTPGVLDIMETKGFNNRRVNTTAAKQLPASKKSRTKSPQIWTATKPF